MNPDWNPVVVPRPARGYLLGTVLGLAYSLALLASLFVVVMAVGAGLVALFVAVVPGAHV